jgi:alpha-L-fucosidase 2
MKPHFLIIAALTFIAVQSPARTPDKSNLLWYEYPANSTLKDTEWTMGDDKHWLDALPLGNGSLGAMVFGDVNQERIQLNEETMWSGSPQDANNPESAKYIPEIRQLLFAGKYKEATDLINATQKCIGAGSHGGKSYKYQYGCFQTAGDLWLDFHNKGEYSHYYRDLNLGTAIATVSYTQGGVNFHREIFTSCPDQVLVMRLTANKKGSLSFDCKLNRPDRYKTIAQDGELIMSGALNDGKGGDGLHYMTRLKAVNKGGEISFKDSILTVEKADEVILYLSTSTDYVLSYPTYKGRDYVKITQANIDKAAALSYKQLKERHIKDYQQYFDRVSFSLLGSDYSLPIDKRLDQARKGKVDCSLIELGYKFGRYLLISSSRPGTMPANLQGIWANKLQTAWNGDYHTDINIQMNYWAADNSNLSELQMPYFDLLESLVKPGQQTAKEQYGLKGWVMHPITNIWGYTSPGESAGWGMHIGASGWLCQHIMEHYRYIGDKDFLNRMYPVLRGAVEFYKGWLTTDPVTGKLVSGPSVSPENAFIAPDGTKTNFSMGPTHDQQVIKELFDDFAEASKILGINDSFVQDVAKANGRLQGTELCPDGRIKEWKEEFQETQPNHRHMSHLYGLYPASQINMINTPDLAQGAVKVIERRLSGLDDSGTYSQPAWNLAWLACNFARLYQGDKADWAIRKILSNRCSNDMFFLHPPFQIDANFGFIAGVDEMLLQSHVKDADGDYIIEFLPALPTSWKSGKITGLKARGGFLVDIEWNNGELKSAHIKSLLGNNFTYKYRDTIKKVPTLKKGGTLNL